MRCGEMACSHNCIGMYEWTGCSGALHLDAPTPRPTDVTAAPPLSTGASSSKQKQPHLLSEDVKRFDFASDEDLSELAKGLVPHSAAKSTQWAVKNFEDWRNARNACHPDNPIPHSALDSCDPGVINLQPSRFIVVTWKSNGERYTPSSLHQLLCGLLRSMREKNPECPNFLDKKDVRFKRIQGTLDTYFHKLHSEGIGSTHWHMYLPGPAHSGTCTYQGQHTLAHVPTRASTHWRMYLPGEFLDQQHPAATHHHNGEVITPFISSYPYGMLHTMSC